MAPRLELDAAEVRASCARGKVAELAVFGSVSRDDFGLDSELDVLVSPEKGVTWSLMDLGTMREDLVELSGRPVDLMVRRAVEESPNWIRRKADLKTQSAVLHQLMVLRSAVDPGAHLPAHTASPTSPGTLSSLARSTVMTRTTTGAAPPP